ncbi:MAG TPA: hypothetical protein VIM47_00910 [Dermatophilaceae bacterium]
MTARKPTTRNPARKATAPKPAAVATAALVPPRVPTDRLGKLPRRVTVGIYLDDTAVAAVVDADADLTAARERLDASRPRRIAEARAAATPEDVIGQTLVDQVHDLDAQALAPLEEAATAALDALDAATRWFTFRGLGRTPYRELLEKHAARDVDDQVMADLGQGDNAPYNLDTFPPALVQAASIDPVLDGDDIATIFDGDTWNGVEVNTLVSYAQLAQSQAPVADPKRHRG